MTADRRLLEIRPSPNNMKARIALQYKGLAFATVPIDPQDRAELVRVSGQPLTPVLLDRGQAVWDSAAILRYLDSAYRDTPPLFSTDRDLMREIERWEWIGRSSLAQPFLVVLRMAFAGKLDAAAAAAARADFRARTAELETVLAAQPYLCGDQLSAADVTCAPIAYYSVVPAGEAAAAPLGAFMHEHFALGDGRDGVRAWTGRVMSWWR